MNLFYQPNITGNTIAFEPDESRHILKVLRKTKGDEILVTDGAGKMFFCTLTSDQPRQCEARVIRTEQQDRRDRCRLHMAVSPTKNIGRYEWFLEKATEIGVDEITPVICRNSERNRINTSRLNKVLIAAMKQSLKVFLPVLHPAVPYTQFIEKTNTGQAYIAYMDSESPDLMIANYNKGKSNVVLVGPEGDFTTGEVKDAIRAGYRPVSLGKSRLRTETAGVVACHTISLLENV